jgi:hypothetical protein
MQRQRSPTYVVPDPVLIYLIEATVTGSQEHQLAAKLLLNCLRLFQTKDAVGSCVHEAEEYAILDVGSEVRALASRLDLLP